MLRNTEKDETNEEITQPLKSNHGARKWLINYSDYCELDYGVCAPKTKQKAKTTTTRAHILLAPLPSVLRTQTQPQDVLLGGAVGHCAEATKGRPPKSTYRRATRPGSSGSHCPLPCQLPEPSSPPPNPPAVSC